MEAEKGRNKNSSYNNQKQLTTTRIRDYGANKYTTI